MRDEFLRMLYEKHFETVFDYCLPKLGFDNDAAADCAHAVFDEAGKQYEKLANHPNLLGWLMTTAKHKLHKAWRRSTRERLRLIPLDLAEAVPDGGDPFAAVELTERDIERVTAVVLSGLSESELEIYTLFFRENLGFDKIAERLGISEKAARARLARVKAKLKSRIAELT